MYVKIIKKFCNCHLKNNYIFYYYDFINKICKDKVNLNNYIKNNKNLISNLIYFDNSKVYYFYIYVKTKKKCCYFF